MDRYCRPRRKRKAFEINAGGYGSIVHAAGAWLYIYPTFENEMKNIQDILFPKIQSENIGNPNLRLKIKATTGLINKSLKA
jgi:hypothetical protein